MAFSVGAYTDAGIRKKINQDAYGLRVVESGPYELGFAIVCDGIGGMSEGELASGLVVCAFLEWFQVHMTELLMNSISQEELFHQWTCTIYATNRILLKYAQEHRLNIGTTATLLLISHSRLFAMNIGDTRLYQIYNKKIEQITKDHTLVQEEVDQGIITLESAITDKRKNILTRCIGLESKISPDFYSGDIHSGSIYLLCSDGFRNVLKPQEIYHNIALSGESNNELSNCLRNLAETAKRRGEKDNITAVALRIESNHDFFEQTVDLEDTISIVHIKNHFQAESAQLWVKNNSLSDCL